MNLNKTLANNIFRILMVHGFPEKEARIITAQSAFETAGWTSDLVEQNNNYFGMKYAGQALSTGEKNGFANYLNMEDSLQDYRKWFTLNAASYKPEYSNSVTEYVAWLKSIGYFEAPEFIYSNGVREYFNAIFA